LNEAREETKRHILLVEHINRIESGLQSRAEAEKENLQKEKEALLHSVETLRKQLDDRALLEEQRTKVAEEEIRALRSRLEQKVAEASSLSEQLSRERVTTTSAQERCNLLEKQLTVTQERLSRSMGTQIVESSLSDELSQKELALERAVAEIQSLKTQILNSEAHVEQFRKLSAANEAALNELRSRVSSSQAAQELELARARAECDAAQKDLLDFRANSQALLQETEDARAELRNLKSEYSEKLSRVEEALELSKSENQRLSEQASLVSSEISKYQAAEQLAFQNYERELQMHAHAQRELSSLRQQLEELRRSLVQEQQRSAELSAQCIRKEAQVRKKKTNR
jgi:nucleoprotein TPR